MQQQRRPLTAGEQRRYTREVHRFMDIYRDLILMYYDNDAFEVFMHPRSRFGLVETINSILRGNMRRSFGYMVAAEAFSTLPARSNRRVRIVPQLDYTES